jgi:hypothetical protein
MEQGAKILAQRKMSGKTLLLFFAPSANLKSAALRLPNSPRCDDLGENMKSFTNGAFSRQHDGCPSGTFSD